MTNAKLKPSAMPAVPDFDDDWDTPNLVDDDDRNVPGRFGFGEILPFVPDKIPDPWCWGALAMALHLFSDNEDRVFTDFNVSRHQVDQLMQNKLFRLEMKAAAEQIRDLPPGQGYKRRAAYLAERQLPIMHAMVEDPTTPPAVRTDLMKLVNRIAGLDPGLERNKPAADDSGAGRVQVIFQYGAGLPGMPEGPMVVNAQKTIENEPGEPE